jgi:hypothetical protein
LKQEKVSHFRMMCMSITPIFNHNQLLLTWSFLVLYRGTYAADDT